MSDVKTGQVGASAAEVYENFFVPALFEQWPPHLLRAANVEPGHRVLDIACGSGVLARAAAKVVGAVNVVGLDPNDGMLKTAVTTAPEIEWTRGWAEDLPFESEDFDRVVSQFGLMFFSDPGAAVREMLRVLRPGGRLAVAVWGPLEETPGYAAVTEMLQRLFGEEAAEAIRAPYAMGDADALRTLFVDAGAKNLEVRTVVEQANFESIDAWMYTDVRGWTLSEMLDDAQYETLRHEAHDQLARFVGDDGRVHFATPAHIVTATKVSV